MGTQAPPFSLLARFAGSFHRNKEFRLRRIFGDHFNMLLERLNSVRLPRFQTALASSASPAAPIYEQTNPEVHASGVPLCRFLEGVLAGSIEKIIDTCQCSHPFVL